MPSQRRMVNLLGLSSERRYNSAISLSEILRLSRYGMAILPRGPSSWTSVYFMARQATKPVSRLARRSLLLPYLMPRRP